MAGGRLNPFARNEKKYKPASTEQVMHGDPWQDRSLPAIPKNATVEEESKEDDDSPLYNSDERPWWKRFIIACLRFLFVIGVLGLLFGIPLMITASNAYNYKTKDDTLQLKNFIFWFFVWIEYSLGISCIGYVIARLFPYVFYAVATVINPAHRRYWRLMKPFTAPFTVCFTIIVAWATFDEIVVDNGLIAYAWAEEVNTLDLISNILGATLSNAIFWGFAYFIQKLVMTYISVHYHHRTNYMRIQQSKAMIDALATLYKASLSLDPLYCDRFVEQDILIRRASEAAARAKPKKVRFFDRMGGASRSVLSTFGTMLGSTGSSHWLQPGSTYVTVERAISQPAAAQAIAQRIWISLVPSSKTALTKDHIAEILPLDRREDAELCFKALDENENGDIRLSEFEMTVREVGKNRRNIYNTIHDIDHCMNTFNWILHLYVSAFMIFIICVNYVEFLSKLKDILGLVGLGLAFAIGRVIADFLNGCVFIFFKHPYDVGDRIELFNGGEGLSVGVIVKRISLLYCVFQRTDTGATVQFSNSRLWDKRIENHTRSEQGSEKLTMFLDINTSFKDLEYLRDELKNFLARPDNSRDYKPGVSLRVKSIHELNKMEVAMVVTHKSNWSNDALKSARSSRLYCALIDISRRVPLSRPTDPKTQVGDAARPNYTVVLSDEDAFQKKQVDQFNSRQKRYDFDLSNEGLDTNAEVAKKAAQRDAEQTAYVNLASIPATMAGRAGERPGVSRPQVVQSSFSRQPEKNSADQIFETEFGSRYRR